MANPFQYQSSVFKKKNPLEQTFSGNPFLVAKKADPKAVRSNADGTVGYMGQPTNTNPVSSNRDGTTGYMKYPSYNKPDTNQPQYEQPEEFDYNKTYNDYLQQMQDSQAQRYGQAQGNAIQANQVGIDQTLRGYEQTKQNLQGQIPMLEKRSNQTQDLIKKGLESVYKQGETSKSNIKDQSGETLRQQAQAKREVDAKRNAIFAGNNTVDSFGFGGYQLEQSNADSDFLREQNKTLRARDQQLAEIDSQITSAEAQAQSQINNEIAKFEDAVRVISQQLGDNEIAKQNAIENAYLKLQDTLFQINDSYNTNTAGLYEKQLELMKAATEDSRKELPAAQFNNISDYDNSLSEVNNLEYLIGKNSSLFDPVKNAFRSRNPYDTEIQNFDSDLRRVAQIVGKAMEGGVLRKEDEEKYRKMLPNLGDTKETANYKIQQVKNMLVQNRNQLIQNFEQGGYNTGASYSTAQQQPTIDNDPLGIMQ